MKKEKRKRKQKRKKKLPQNRIKTIAITLGDPEGIGPEVILKSLHSRLPKCAVVIIGTSKHYPDNSIPVIRHISEIQKQGIYFYHIDPKILKEPSFQYVKTGVEFALAKKVDALVTAPISKEKWLRAGIKYNGHTEYLAKAAGIHDYSMFFWSENLKVSLFTIHIPLKKVFGTIKKREIKRFIQSLDRELQKWFKQKFTFLVSGLNPHAGEEGFLGKEEIEEIIPALQSLAEDGERESENRIYFEGPFPPDVVFLKALGTKNSVVISWYHDQGLIPFKLLNIHSGVNLTLGLPYIRTSPVHGTAYDIAGKNMANPSSMTAAIKLAEELA